MGWPGYLLGDNKKRWKKREKEGKRGAKGLINIIIIIFMFRRDYEHK
jgi:hypothetical protein